MTENIRGLFGFIKDCPDPYHAAKTVADRFISAEYKEVSESFAPTPGKYFIRRGNGIIAFRIPENAPVGFTVTASHMDSPCFRLKPRPDVKSANYVTLRTERYGGMINYTWFDRPLELSGRAYVTTHSGIKPVLFRSNCPAGVIPSVAPHFNREINKSFTADAARDLVPLFGEFGASAAGYIARLCGVSEGELVSFDGVLSCMDEPKIFGAGGKFILSPRLDDLMCVYGCLEGFLGGENTKTVPVFCVFDGEEIGSRLRDGAASDLLSATLRRIAGSEDNYRRMAGNSLLISADNAHGLHPNHPELSDGADVRLNGGVTVKRSASRSYMTEGDSQGIVTEICRRGNIPVQYFTNRSDIPGGSTLGAIAVTGLPVMCADIGMAQLAMHSAVETAGAEDVEYMVSFAKELYNTAIEIDSDGEIRIERSEK